MPNRQQNERRSHEYGQAPEIAQNDTDCIGNAFKSAKQDFMKNLKHPERYDFTNLSSAQTVYEVAKAIEKRQSKTKTLSALGRIEPYIKGLEGYVGVIDTFTQSNADLLCLIWGPLKLILQMASSLTSAFRKVVEVLAEIGRVLPQFETYTKIFNESQTIHHGLFLFYRDILEFHAALLNFFAHKNLNVFLEALWPKLRGEIDNIKAHIAEDASLITSNASMEHIKATEKLRRLALVEFRNSQRFRDDEKFLSLSQVLESKACKSKLQDIISGTKNQNVLGDWLRNDSEVVRWLAAENGTCRYIWLQGIPGAGKTFLTANLIRRMQSQNDAVLYAFLDHRNQDIVKCVKLWHSLIFQLLSHNRDMCSVVHECFVTKYSTLTTDVKYAENLFCELLELSGAVHVVIDGIDEVEESARIAVLESMLSVTRSHSNMRLMLSSRPERDIEIKIRERFHVLRVDYYNKGDIENYVQSEGNVWASELQECGADAESCQQIRTALGAVVERANGMFLYAKLVLSVARSHANLEDILDELRRLPTGLDDAYGRILSRLRSLSPGLRRNTRRVLMWVASSRYPLRESEILQALSVDNGKSDFAGSQRKSWLDMRKACGPIIEIANSVVQFVHFTAKEYFFGPQSGLFLSLPEAEVELASTCVTYLAFQSFNLICREKLSPGSRKSLREQILAGDFLLFQYAASSWLQHIRCCSMMLEKLELQKKNANDLKTYLSGLFTVRQRESLDDEELVALAPHFVGLAAGQELQPWLDRSHNFATKLRSCRISHDDDPIMVCSALMRFRRELDLMHCPASDHANDCTCAKLKHLYGEDTFRCDYVSCEFYTRGFGTLLEREQHLTMHRKPFKCPERDCLFADLGFSSSGDLSRHTHATHVQRATVDSGLSSSMLSQLPQGDIYRILEDSIRDDQVNLVKSLFPTARDEPEFPIKLRNLFLLASAKASGDMVAFLLDAATIEGNPTLDLDQALAAAIDGQNFYTSKTLLERGADVNREVSLPDLVELELPDVPRYRRPRYRVWSRWNLVPINRAFGLLHTAIIHLLVERHGANLDLFTGFGYINTYGISANYDDDDPEFAIRLGQLSGLFRDGKLLEAGLLHALNNDSLSILEFCLASGADVNKPEESGETPLSKFLKSFYGKNVEKKGKMLKAILRHGDDQGVQAAICGLGVDRPELVHGVEVHFGTTWREFVLSIRAGDEASK